MHVHRALFIFICAVVSAVLVGAGTAPSDDLTSAEQDLIELFGSKLAMKPIKGGTPIDRESLVKAWMTSMTGGFLETHGPHKGKVLKRSVTSTKKYPAKWPNKKNGAITINLPGEFVYYEVHDDDRGVMIPTELDIANSVHVVYEPGELALPAGKDTSEYTTSVKVYALHDPGSVEHSGSLRINAQDRGEWNVTTPAGTFPCVMYTIRYDGKVGPASVKETAIVFANAEHGCIAKVTRNKVTAFLVYNSDQREALVLVEKP